EARAGARGPAAATSAGGGSQRLQHPAETTGQPPQIRDRLPERAAAERIDAVVLLSPSAPLRRRVADADRHVPLLLQPAERLVDRAHRELAGRFALELVLDRDAVGVVPETQHGE